MLKALYTGLVVLGKSLISDGASGAGRAHTVYVDLLKKLLDYNVKMLGSVVTYISLSVKICNDILSR
jgi:hypothetical protein